MQNLTEILHKHFGFGSFRTGQEEIITSILNGRDTLAVMPTGGGKSLCYQLPAITADGTAIVISPLIALMKDQVDGLLKNNLPATLINSTLNYYEIADRLNLAASGKLKLLYIAPERLESKQFIEALAKINVSFIAVDEAHCISEWGHDFRPSYLRINDIFKYLPRVPVMALTATATPEVQDDIVKLLNMKNAARFIKGFDRPNLNYQTINASNKSERIVKQLKKTTDGSSIIYAGTRKRVEKFADEIKSAGIKVYRYHAGLNEFERKRQQEGFINDTNAVVVATNAFGMGIDKPNVRNVIHVDYTSTLEAYYQEAGRAGRDGKPADCILIYEPQDFYLQEFFIKSSYPERSDIIKVYDTIYDIAQVSTGSGIGMSVFSSTEEIANKAGLSLISTRSIIKLLEKHKLILIGSNQGFAKIKLNYDRNRIYDYYENLSEDKKTVLEAILRSVSSEAFRHTIDVDTVNMLAKYDLSNALFKRALREFQIAGVVTYIAPQTATGLTLLSERMSRENIAVDFDKIDTRRELAYKKFNIVRRYAETLECKRNFILEYFGESASDGTCGRCSSCLKQTTVTVLSEKEKFLIAEVTKAVAVLGERYGKALVRDFLKGTRNKRINERRLYDLEGFAAAKDLPGTEIMSGINSALISGYVTPSADMYPVLKLTLKGRKKVKTKAAKISFTSVQGDADINSIYEKFKILRQNLANDIGIQPRGIISDRTMRTLAKQQPQTLEIMNDIRGVSPAFIENFGELFLEIIIDEINAAKELNNKENKAALKPVYTKLNTLLKSKLPLNKIAVALDSTKAETARLIQELFEAGDFPDTGYLFDTAIYEQVKAYLSKYPHAILKDVKAALNLKTGLPTLRIIIAKARAELKI
jgi:ATP-dependent DNA helicase RecQ